MQTVLTLRRLFTALAVAGSLSLTLPVLAQAAPAPTPTTDSSSDDAILDAILNKVTQNLAEFHRSLPSFLAKETVVFEASPAPTPSGKSTNVTGAVFRVLRATGSDGKPSYDQARVFTSIDGHPPARGQTGEDSPYIGPITEFEAFTHGLYMVSDAGELCYEYRLHPARKNHPKDKSVIDFEDLPASRRSKSCSTNGETSGEAVYDPSTLQVLHVESKTLNHRSSGDSAAGDFKWSSIRTDAPPHPGDTSLETWEWSSDYAPVVLDGSVFWMPTSIRFTISARIAAADDGPLHDTDVPLTHMVEATYSDYQSQSVASAPVTATDADQEIKLTPADIRLMQALPNTIPARDAPALDAILTRITKHLDDYRSTVPSFLVKEHAVSEVEPYPNPGGTLKTATEAVFRVRRSTKPDGTTALTETRTFTSIDGDKPPPTMAAETSNRVGPMAIFGAFTHGLDLISNAGKPCLQYHLHLPRKGHATDKIVIDFEVLSQRRHDQSCPVNGQLSGHATVDPTSMQVLHVETRTLNHHGEMGPETWDWSVDYAPVTLGGKLFWLPASIRSKATTIVSQDDTQNLTNTNPFLYGSMNQASEPTTHTLQATYTDYHLLNVTSTIYAVTDSSGNIVPAPVVPNH